MKTKSKATAPAAPVTSPLHTSCAVLEQRLGPIEERALHTLRGYEGHARKHPEKQIVQLMASIGHFGFTMPVLVDGDAVLIAGHARLEAARRLGMTHVPVLIARNWSKAQVKAYRLADNQLSRQRSRSQRPFPKLDPNRDARERPPSFEPAVQLGLGGWRLCPKFRRSTVAARDADRT